MVGRRVLRLDAQCEELLFGRPGDVVVADDEGIVVIPLAKAEEVLKKAQAKADNDAKQSLDAWEKNHRSKVDATLKAKGYIA